MSNDDSFYNDPEENDRRDDFGDEERDPDSWQDETYYEDSSSRQKKNPTLKVILILMTLVGGLFLLCCCGVGFTIYRGFESTEDPADVRRVSSEIVEIDVPDNYQPELAFELKIPFYYSIKMAKYRITSEINAGADLNAYGMLVLMEVDVLQGEVDAEQELGKRLAGQRGQQNRDLKINSTEMRNFQIRGQDAQFLFQDATERNTQIEFMQITGSFPGKNGTAILMLQIKKEDYHEEEVVRMIESIR